MAAPPTITENSALFLAQQASLKRSQRRSLRLIGLLRSMWSATKTVAGKIVTVVRTSRRF